MVKIAIKTYYLPGPWTRHLGLYFEKRGTVCLAAGTKEDRLTNTHPTSPVIRK
jgi:hypothetical protein